MRAKKGKNTSDIKFRYKENTSAYSNVFTKDPNFNEDAKNPRRGAAFQRLGKFVRYTKGSF